MIQWLILFPVLVAGIGAIIAAAPNCSGDAIEITIRCPKSDETLCREMTGAAVAVAEKGRRRNEPRAAAEPEI